MSINSLTEQDEMKLADAAMVRVCKFLKLDAYAVSERAAILIYDGGENVQAAHRAAVREVHLQQKGFMVDERFIDACLIRGWFLSVNAGVNPWARQKWLTDLICLYGREHRDGPATDEEWRKLLEMKPADLDLESELKNVRSPSA